MRPMLTQECNAVFKLPGGDERSDLPVQRAVDSNNLNVLVSRWDLTDEEREAIQNGALVRLVVWGEATPPVAMAVEGVEYGDEPSDEA